MPKTPEWYRKRKEVAAFKKAFKKKTGVAADSKDWNKLLLAFQTKVGELANWTNILVANEPDEADLATAPVEHWRAEAKKIATTAKNDLPAAGKAARDKLPLLLKSLEAVRRKAKAQPARRQVDGRELSVYMTDIPGFADMNKKQQDDAMEAAARKTARGLTVFESIADGTLDVDADDLEVEPADVEALVWALKSKAQDKNRGPYQKGAMTVPNGESLRKFLDKCPQVYSRQSSHLREQQAQGVKGGIKIDNAVGQTPRGMDFYNSGGDDRPGTLPAGMNALLYQQVVLPNGEVALYVKMETEGSYGHPGDNRKIDPTVPPDRAKHPNDGARARKHLKNLMVKEAGDTDLPGLREQTPQKVVEAAKEMVAAVEGKKAKAYLKSSYGTEYKLTGKNKAVPRISYFLSAIEDCVAHQRNGEDGWEFGQAAEDLLDKLASVMQATIPADLLEKDRRLGEEIVLTGGDLSPAAQGQGQHGGDDDSQEGEEDDSEEDDVTAGLDEPDEDESERADESGENVVALRQVSLLCAEFVDAIKERELRRSLQKTYYEALEQGDAEALKRFFGVAGKATAEQLGKQADRMYDRIDAMLDQL